MLSEAIRTVKEMDKALTGMAVVTHMTREETAELIPQIQKLAKETSTAMTEIANLVTEYTKQGRSLKESFILAEETAKAAKIAGISAAESIQYMTSAINGFNLAAKDATRVSDIFANLAAASATDYEQLAIALSKVSAQANLAGLSIEYTTALLAKGIETTQEAPESIGTALKTILARMRELSDYGKTLEDGASVNKVENALSAAGIKLRDLNGEFRELEDIFNELGPKWDDLNTMQQQAIAQAVAGTRQQSRFVAIMQDWERTQELAAEAQDSAGASAAQYAEQAKGMEAAMTNLTTSWQSFIQSLTDSEFLIGTVRFLTKTLDGLTKILSSGGDFTKNLVIGLVSVTALIKGLQTIGKVRESIASWIKNNTEDEAEAAEKVADEKRKSLEYEKTMLELRLKANKKALNDSYEKQEELDSSESTDDDAYTNLLAEQTRLLEEQKMLKEQIASIDGSIAETTNGTVQLEYNLKQQIQMLDAEAQANALTKLDSQIAANEALQLQLEMEEAILQKEKEITDEKIKQLQAELMDTDDSDLERQAELKAQINKLEADQEGRNKSIAKLVTKRGKLEKANLKLDQKRSKIVNGETKSYKKTLSIVKTLANKVLKKFGVDTSKIEKGWSGIKTLFGKVKDTGDQNNISLSKLLDGQKQSVKNYDDMLKSGQLIVNGEKKRALTEDEIANITERKKHAEESIQNIQAAQKDLGEQGLVTQKQAGELLNMEQATQEAVLVVQEGQSTAEGAETAAQTAGLPSEVAEAGANISAAASQPYGSGIPLAVMGVAALAAVGLAGGLAGIISANSGGTSARDQKMESKIADSQNIMYEAKKQNKEISASKDRYIELSSKTDLSIEEQEELQELTESIQDMDESFANKTGPDLIDAMNDLTRKNENIINKEIEASYQNALKMDNLAASELGRQAVENKIIKSQEELIKSNSALAMANKAVVDSVTEKTAAMADSFADNMSEEKFGTANGYG
jgi:TP901 family phage tail tape measure protein